MPISTEIAVAAAMYKQNDAMLAKSIAGLTDAEWKTRPNDNSNCVLWVVGHSVWARSMVLSMLGGAWTRPWLGKFVRGSKPVDASEYPSAEEIVTAWAEVSDSLKAAMESAPLSVLEAPAPEKMPTFDGKMSGLVGFLAYHETYHVGQLAYLRCWLGHERVAG